MVAMKFANGPFKIFTWSPFFNFFRGSNLPDKSYLFFKSLTNVVGIDLRIELKVIKREILHKYYLFYATRILLYQI